VEVRAPKRGRRLNHAHETRSGATLPTHRPDDMATTLRTEHGVMCVAGCSGIRLSYCMDCTTGSSVRPEGAAIATSAGNAARVSSHGGSTVEGKYVCWG